MKLPTRLPLSFVLFTAGFLLAGCPLSQFRAGIPDTEEVNTSVYAEEITAGRMAKLREKGDLVGALSNGMAYMVRGMGSETTGRISWEMGLTLRAGIEKPEVVSFLGSLEKSARTVFKVTSNVDGSGYTYNDGHFTSLFDARLDYELEKKAVALVYLPDLRSGTNETVLRSNLATADTVSRRWPDTPGLLGKMQDKNLFPLDEYSKRQKDVYDEALERVRLAAIQEPFGQDRAEWRAVTGAFAKARNRPHNVRSRILADLGPWEEVEVLGTIGGDTNLPEGWDKATLEQVKGSNAIPDVSHAWARIRFGGGRFAFVESKWIGEPTGDGRDARAFRDAATLYYHHDYLAAAEKAAALVQGQGNRVWCMRGMALLHATHLQISRRATSKKNPYTAYAFSRHEFFRYHEVDHLLAPSDLLVRHLLRLDGASPMALAMEMR